MRRNFDVLISDEAKSFIRSLDKKVQKKVAYNIQMAREVNDPKLFKKLNSEIWEFRTNYDKQQIRLFRILGSNSKFNSYLYTWFSEEDTKDS